MDATILNLVGAPDLPAAKESISRLAAAMGAGGSSPPPPPPRVYKSVPLTTLHYHDLPPIITEAARELLASVAGLRNAYLSGDETHSGPAEIDSVVSQLEHLITQAQKACNIRDYTALLVEQTILRLATDSGPPPAGVLELARVVNPFLNQQGDDRSIRGGVGPSSAANGDRRLPAPFRSTDLAMVAETERDLLVLLYYCDLVNLKSSPDEALSHLARMTEKYGKIPDLDIRKDPLSETEVYIHWTIFYLTTNITTTTPPDTLTPASQSHLNTELGIQLSRLLTLCEMLVDEARLDQVCFLLMFLRRCALNAQKRWWKSRVKTLLSKMTKKRPGRQPWHTAYAEKTQAGLKRLEEDGGERWSRRGSLMIQREDWEMGKRKGD